MNKSESLCQLPPAMPEVVMDIGLGENAELIDFDYNSFYEMARTHGVTDEDIEQLTVHFTTKSGERKFGLGCFMGKYRHRSRKITVHPEAYKYSTLLLQPIDAKPEYVENGGEALTPEQRGDATVRHEVGHWLYYLDKSNASEVKRNERIRQVACGSLALSIAGTVVAPIVLQKWEALMVPIPGWFTGLLAYAAFDIKREGRIRSDLHNAADHSLLEDVPTDAYDRRNNIWEWPAYLHEAVTRNSPLLIYEKAN